MSVRPCRLEWTTKRRLSYQGPCRHRTKFHDTWWPRGMSLVLLFLVGNALCLRVEVLHF